MAEGEEIDRQVRAIAAELDDEWLRFQLVELRPSGTDLNHFDGISDGHLRLAVKFMGEVLDVIPQARLWRARTTGGRLVMAVLFPPPPATSDVDQLWLMGICNLAGTASERTCEHCGKPGENDGRRTACAERNRRG